MSKARQAIPTITFVDEYCRLYQDLFPDVRSFEHFKFLHIGMLSEIKRKTLPAIARVGGDLDQEALHHFVANARLLRRRVAQETAHFVTPGESRVGHSCCALTRPGTEKRGKPPLMWLTNTLGTWANWPTVWCLSTPMAS